MSEEQYQKPIWQHDFSQHNFWSKRIRRGAGGKSFSNAEELLEAADEYFDWANGHPLKAEKLFHYQGSVTAAKEHRLRAFTFKGLCIFVGISSSTYEKYRQDPEMSKATAIIDDIVWTQKYEGAAADLLNASIVTRDLGLVDKIEATNKNENNTTIKADALSKEAKKELLRAMDAAAEEGDAGE